MPILCDLISNFVIHTKLKVSMNDTRMSPSRNLKQGSAMWHCFLRLLVPLNNLL